MNRVSIIIPVYNAEKTLGYCLDSILNNTYKDYEVILINDGSKDNSQKIIDKYVRMYPKKFRSYSQKNSGTAVARNRGIKYSRGKYIFFIDNDDYIDKDYIEKFVDAIEEKDAEMVIGGYRRVKPNGKERFVRKAVDSPWTKYMMVTPWGRVYKRDPLIKAKLQFLKSEIGEDVYLNLIANFKLKVETLDYIGYNWVYNPYSVSNTTHKKLNPFVDLTKVFTTIKKEIDIIEIPNSEKEFLEYFFIKTSIWYLLHSGRGVRYDKLKKEYDKLFGWLENNYPNYLKNKQIGVFTPKGEDFFVRVVVWFFLLLKRVHLEKVFMRLYSRI
jgi:glycosyltransferase involved in cell wall biosynthesis